MDLPPNTASLRRGQRAFFNFTDARYNELKHVIMVTKLTYLNASTSDAFQGDLDPILLIRVGVVIKRLQMHLLQSRNQTLDLLAVVILGFPCMYQMSVGF